MGWSAPETNGLEGTLQGKKGVLSVGQNSGPQRKDFPPSKSSSLPALPWVRPSGSEGEDPTRPRLSVWGRSYHLQIIFLLLSFYVYLLLFLSLSFLLLYLLFFILLLFSLKSTVKFMMCLWSARHRECK